MGVAKSGRWKGSTWKLAPCLIALEAEADAIAPNRRKGSDGSIGDANHSVRRSDHNPDEEGNIDWVDALDITHDPQNGMDIHARLRVVAQNVKNGIEPRVDYLISNDEIFSKKNGVWAWREYDGSNEHRGHGHISVNDQHRFNTSRWFTGVPAFPTPEMPPPYNPPSTLGSFNPPEPGVPMKFFISDPAYGIRLVITDGHCVMDYGVTSLEQLARTGTFIGGPMTPAQFDSFWKKYPGGRIAMGHLPK